MPVDDYTEQIVQDCEGVVDLDENDTLDYDKDV